MENILECLTEEERERVARYLSQAESALNEAQNILADDWANKVEALRAKVSSVAWDFDQAWKEITS